MSTLNEQLPFPPVVPDTEYTLPLVMLFKEILADAIGAPVVATPEMVALTDEGLEDPPPPHETTGNRRRNKYSFFINPTNWLNQYFNRQQAR